MFENGLKNTISFSISVFLFLYCATFCSTLSYGQNLENLDVVFSEGFEAGNLDRWGVTDESRLLLETGLGIAGSTALSAEIENEAAYLSVGDEARFESGFLSFDFHPNSVILPYTEGEWLPGQSIIIASMRGADPWVDLVSIHVRQTTEGEYKAFLSYRSETESVRDHVEGEFDLENDWQHITIGFKAGSWVGAWIDGSPVRILNDIDHLQIAAKILAIGQNQPIDTNPSGTVLFDNVKAFIPHREDIWVSQATGDDNRDGSSTSQAVQTIQRALNMVSPGSTVHIQPGIYRESLRPATSGHANDPIVIQAEAGEDTVFVRGSIASSDLTWTQLSSNTIGLPAGVNPTQIYEADLSSFNITQAPRFVTLLNDTDRSVTRMPLAREPDWQVQTEWKHHEYWWAATGGNGPSPYIPPFEWDETTEINGENANRSSIYLTDDQFDTEPADIEAGDLTTLPSLVGADIWVMGTSQGHNTFKREIVAHDRSEGKIEVDEPCVVNWHVGLGWGSKYFVENLPSLLDNPGEWWFDEASQKIYFWPTTATNPENLDIEISWLDHGMDLSHRSYVTVDGLNFEFFERDMVRIENGDQKKSQGVNIKNIEARYGNQGVYLHQNTLGPPEFIIENFTLEDSEISHMDTFGIKTSYWFGAEDPVDGWTRAGVQRTLFRNNELHHLAFRSDYNFPVGNTFSFADKLRFEGNHVHHTAHCGLNFWAAMDVTKPSFQEDGFEPEEIRTGEVFVYNNIFEKACQLNADCGALKIGGSPPYKHVFRDFLVMNNVFRDTYGWTYASVKRGARFVGDASPRTGLGGKGFYIDYATGIHAYGNVAYNNGHIGYSMYGYWRNGEVIYFNNIAANNPYGIRMSGHTNESDDLDVVAMGAQIKNNIIVNNEGDGLYIQDRHGTFENIEIDHNAYFGNGWRTEEGASFPGDMVIYIDDQSWSDTEHFQNVSEIQEATPWEDHGLSADPLFVSYDWADHDFTDGSWPDFTLDSASPLHNMEMAPLPDSMTRLIEHFDVEDPQPWGLWIPTYNDDAQNALAPRISSGCALTSSQPSTAPWYLLLLLVVFGLKSKKSHQNRKPIH